MQHSRLQLFTQVIYGYYTFPETCPYWLEASFCIPKLGIFTITKFCFPFVCIILCLLILHFICYFILESLTVKKSSWAPYRHFWFWLCNSELFENITVLLFIMFPNIQAYTEQPMSKFRKFMWELDESFLKIEI